MKQNKQTVKNHTGILPPARVVKGIDISEFEEWIPIRRMNISDINSSILEMRRRAQLTYFSNVAGIATVGVLCIIALLFSFNRFTSIDVEGYIANYI